MLTNHSNTSRSVELVLRNLEKGTVTINDSYQRKFVWIDHQIKRELIKTMILGMPIGTIMIWNKEGVDRLQGEVVDGQQRLTTIRTFIKNDKNDKNKFALDENTLRSILKNEQILNVIKDEADKDQKAKNLVDLLDSPQGFKKFFFGNLPEYFQEKIEDYGLNITIIQTSEENHIRNYFRVLQNQEKLKAGEILHSVPDSLLNNHLDNVDIDNFCKITNFNNLKWGFIKHFTVFMGIILDITRMGQPDKEIVKLSTKILDNELEMNSTFLEIIEKIKIDISNPEQTNLDKRLLTVLGLKLLLLTYLFGTSEFLNLSLQERASVIKTITHFAGYWNSKDENKKERLKSGFGTFQNYDTEKLIDGIREVWILSKTTHNKKEISEKFDKINYLISFLMVNNLEIINMIHSGSEFDFHPNGDVQIFA